MRYNYFMNLLRKYSWQAFFVIFSVFSPLVSLAEDGVICNPADGKICNPISTNSIPALVHKILEGIVKIGVPIIALAIIYSGFLFVFARGNSEKLTKAKDALLYTIIGATLILGAWALAKLIAQTVGGLG